MSHLDQSDWTDIPECTHCAVVNRQVINSSTGLIFVKFRAKFKFSKKKSFICSLKNEQERIKIILKILISFLGTFSQVPIIQFDSIVFLMCWLKYIRCPLFQILSKKIGEKHDDFSQKVFDRKWGCRIIYT